MGKLGFEEAREAELKLPRLVGSWRKKNVYFYFINYAKDFDCVGHNKLENS